MADQGDKLADQVDKHAKGDGLAKIGMEGFALLDKLYSRQKKPAPRGTVIDRNMASQFYGGLLAVDYGVRIPIPDKNKKEHGALSDVDYGIRKPIPSKNKREYGRLGALHG